jgi:phage tail protein X
MMRFILSDLGRAPAPGATKLDMLEALNAELLDSLARGGNVVVLIDEAQDLTIPVLEELRLLSNLETAKEKILQLVLAGQPELDGLLVRPEIRQLRQRISVRARLRPLARVEVKAYVAARIAAVGGDVRGLFTPAALLRLWWFSGGVPRMVNAVCDNALVTAYAAGRSRVGWREIGEAMRDLRRQVTWVPHRLTRVGTLLAAAAIGGGLPLGSMWLAHERPAAPVLLAAVAPALTVGSPSVVDPNAAAAPASVEVLPVVALPGSSAGGIVPTEAAKPVEAVDVGAVVVPARDASSTPVAVGTAMRPEPPQEAPFPSAQIGGSDAGDLKIRVTEGDTLFHLARRYYGYADPRVLVMIRAANPWIGDPDVLWVGKVVILPAPRIDGSVSPGDDAGAR